MIRTIRRTTAQRALAAAGLLMSGAVLLTGCSSSSSSTASAGASPSASTGGSADGSGSAQFTAYRQCLTQHGVTMPTGRPSGHFSRPAGGFSGRPSGRPSGGYGGGGYGGGFGGGFGGASANPTEAAAAKACASLAPKGGFGGGRGAGGSSALVAFTGCMKDNGVTVTDQQVRSLSTSTDPKTVAAYKICKALLPTGGPGHAAPSATPSA